MFGIAFLAVIAAAGLAVLGLALALVAGVLHLVFRIALFPLFLGVGLIKLIVLPILALVAVVVLVAVAPVVLVVLAVLAVPAAAAAVLIGGLRLIAAV